MRRLLILLLLSLATPLSLAADIDGLVKKTSPYSVSETMDRFESILQSKGMPFTLRLNHAKSARNADIDMRDTELMIFGNPKLGSHLMTSAQTAGIDLPMKALAWRDKDGKVWLAYNDPMYIAARHGIEDRMDILEKMSAALNNLTDAAVAAD